ncbi:hypothetical protein LBMAG48_24030 [Phycisphaerae bacterium]|nr:hypothetical protein LBMAG48_24030 [Phycisphaerae bacterium]
MHETDSVRLFVDALTRFWQSAGWALHRMRRLSRLQTPNPSVETLAEIREVAISLEDARREVDESKSNALRCAIMPPDLILGMAPLEWRQRVQLDLESLTLQTREIYSAQVDGSICELLTRLNVRIEELRLFLNSEKPAGDPLTHCGEIDASEGAARAEAEARGFRARGEAIYPGRLLVIRADSYGIQPADDGAIDPATDRILGIAAWGASVELKPGMVRVEGGYVSLVSGEIDRPQTGVPKVDSWVARADALRKLRRGRVEMFGRMSLTQAQLDASVREIEDLVRGSAISLLQGAPANERPALVTLARVADVTHPDDDTLTAAILELTISAAAWARKGDGVVLRNGLATASEGQHAPPDEQGEEAGVILTSNRARVLRAMAKFDASLALSNETIASETADPEARIPALSSRTVGPIVQYLIKFDLAWRPSGPRSGAALNINGRRQASKIAD